RIEGFQAIVVRIPVTAGDGDEQRQARLAGHLLEGVGGIGGKRPGADVGIPELPALHDGFPVPGPGIVPAEGAGAEGPPALVRGALGETGERVLVMERVEVPRHGAPATARVDAAQILGARAPVVETARSVLTRRGSEPVDPPVLAGGIHANRLEAAAYVRSLARVDHAPRAELELLDAGTHTDAGVSRPRRRPFQEQVRGVEPVLVDR